MASNKWDSTTVYRSNNGCGPLRARILTESPRGTYTMERWHAKNPRRRVRFSLPAWFLGSRSCGWMAVPHAD